MVPVDAETALPTCYRHPDRETRLSCSTCDRPICVDCMRTASVGQKCPECATPDKRARVITADRLRAEGRRTAPFSYGVIGICVALFLTSFVPALGDPVYTFGIQHNPSVAAGQWYRLITAAFLHSPGGIWHIGFNMWALSVFGPTLERQVGTAAFGALYLSSALAGGAVFYFLAPAGSAVGASGAVFGLFGAWLAASYRDRRTLHGRANLQQLLMLLGLNLAITFVFPRIAWQAHLGGLVAGFGIVMAWAAVGNRPDAPRLRTLIAAAVGVLALAAVILL